MSILVIARITFQEAARWKILLAALLLGLVFLAVFGLGFYYIMQDLERNIGPRSLIELNEVRNFLMLAGLYLVVVFALVVRQFNRRDL